MDSAEVSKIDAMRWRPWAGLAGILFVGFALRIAEIGRWPLWNDEALTLLIGHWSILRLFVVPIDPTPGLYYALHKIFLGPMVDAAQARSISLVCGTLTIPAVYWLAKECRIPALLSAALVALSFPLIDYSQEARAYALQVLLVVLSATFLIRWTRFDSRRDLPLALLFGALSFYTHFVSIFWIGPMVVVIAHKARRQAVIPLLILVLVSIPELSRLINYNHVIFSWLAQANARESGDTLSRALLPFRPTGLMAAAMVLILAWRAWVHRSGIARWSRENREAAFVVGMLLASPLLIWTFGLVAKPIFMTRTILIAVPAFMIALALLLSFEHRFARFAVVALYAASLLASGTTRQKEDWRAIAERVGGDPVLLCRPFQAPAMRHALPGNNRVFANYDEGLVEMTGTPWQTSYFETLSRSNRIAEARKLAAATSPDLIVWPIRSGELRHQVAKPMRLGEGLVYCEAYQAVDRAPRYIAD